MIWSLIFIFVAFQRIQGKTIDDYMKSLQNEFNGYQGRPMPPELEEMVKNHTNSNDQLEDCMLEFRECMVVQKFYQVCGYSIIISQPRLFENICEYSYKACVDGEDNWQIVSENNCNHLINEHIQDPDNDDEKNKNANKSKTEQDPKIEIQQPNEKIDDAKAETKEPKEPEVKIEEDKVKPQVPEKKPKEEPIGLGNEEINATILPNVSQIGNNLENEPEVGKEKAKVISEGNKAEQEKTKVILNENQEEPKTRKGIPKLESKLIGFNVNQDDINNGNLRFKNEIKSGLEPNIDKKEYVVVSKVTNIERESLMEKSKFDESQKEINMTSKPKLGQKDYLEESMSVKGKQNAMLKKISSKSFSDETREGLEKVTEPEIGQKESKEDSKHNKLEKASQVESKTEFLTKINLIESKKQSETNTDKEEIIAKPELVGKKDLKIASKQIEMNLKQEKMEHARQGNSKINSRIGPKQTAVTTENNEDKKEDEREQKELNNGSESQLGEQLRTTEKNNIQDLLSQMKEAQIYANRQLVPEEVVLALKKSINLIKNRNQEINQNVAKKHSSKSTEEYYLPSFEPLVIIDNHNRKNNDNSNLELSQTLLDVIEKTIRKKLNDENE